MSNKFVLTTFVLVSVTILSGCGDNKSKKAKFRPKGGAITLKGTATGSCDIMSPGGASGTAEQCKAAEEIVRANAKPECKASWKSEMTRRGCAIDETLFADAPETTPTQRNDDVPPGTIQTVERVAGATGAATAEEVVSTSATDPQTGDTEVSAQPGNAAAAGINSDHLVNTPAPSATGTVPSATSTVPAAVAALVSPEERARFSADNTSCPNLKRINTKAINFASSLDIAKEDPKASLSAWARRVCINDSSRAPKLWTEIKAVFTTSSTWTAADTVSKCSTELGNLAVACANSVRYGGKKTDIWGTRLTAESTPSEIAAAAGETPAAGAAAPADADED